MSEQHSQQIRKTRTFLFWYFRFPNLMADPAQLEFEEKQALVQHLSKVAIVDLLAYSVVCAAFDFITMYSMKIADERVRIENLLQSIASSIESKAEQLRQAITETEQQLQRTLESLVNPRLKQLDLLQKQATKALDEFEKGMCHRQGQGLQSENKQRLSLPKIKLDDSLINQGLILPVFRPHLRSAVSRWGRLEDHTAVQGVIFNPDYIEWRGSHHLSFEVQMAVLSPVGECKDAPDLSKAPFESVYAGRGTSCPVSTVQGVVYAVRVREKFESGWGPFSSVVVRSFNTPAVEGVKFDSTGIVSWSSLTGASKYQVQVAGPSNKYENFYEGTQTSWTFHHERGFGEYRVRVRALFPGLHGRSHDGWSTFSSPLSFRWERLEIFQPKESKHRDHLSSCLPSFPKELVDLVAGYVPSGGGLLSWKPHTNAVGVYRDWTGLKRMALVSSKKGWVALTSTAPLFSPVSSSSRERKSVVGVVTFSVRIDQCAPQGRDIAVGVCGVFQLRSDETKQPRIGYLYHCNSEISHKQAHLRHVAHYGSGDIIGVHLHIGEKTLSFYKNCFLQGEPIQNIDVSKPFNACVIMREKGSRVTLVE